MGRMRLMGIFVMLCLCGWLTGCSDGETKDAEKRGDLFLVDFDRAELQRMEKFVARFHERKGDYLIAIPPIVDGGYWIYDLRSDGKKIDIMIDNTRDGYASDRSQRKLSCGDISLEKNTGDGGTYTDVRVTACVPSEGGDSLQLFSFGVDE